jgi:membrane protease YdiL (CAAX protease family)
MPVLIAWILILGISGFVVFRNLQVGESPGIQKMMSDERARMVGMVAVQMKAMQQEVGTLIKQFENEARTPEDKIRAVILAGELLGVDAALTRLSKISVETLGREAVTDLKALQLIYKNQGSDVGSAARSGLIRRHGYLGRLALAHGVPPDKEPRKSLQVEAFWFTVRVSIVVFGVLGLLGLSIAAFILAGAWFVKGKIRPTYVPKPSVSGAFLEGFAIYLLLFIALGGLLRFFAPLSLQWTWLALVILPVVWMWTFLRGTTAEQRRQAFGWHRGRGVFREIAAGLGGYVAGLVVVAIGVLLTLFLIRVTGARSSSPIVQELNGGPWHIVGLYALACIFAPFMEETMFRGILFHHLRQRWRWIGSAAVVSLIFAALHPQGWAAIPALTAIAMVLAALREWRDSLIAPMTAHACSNFLVLTLALLLVK